MAASAAHGAINISGFTSINNDRFANNVNFIANSFDLSGIAIVDTNQSNFTGDDGGRWIAMISDNVFITAHHFFPANGASATFYGSNDPSGLSATRTIQSSQRIGTSDLRIGTLDTPLGAGFASYDFATEDITNINALDPDSLQQSQYGLKNAYILGRSETEWATSQDIAVGRNIIDYWLDSVTVAGTTDDALATIVNQVSDGNFVSDEAGLAVGDSGAPMLVEDETGNLTIVGINWFIATAGETNINGFSYVGNYDTEIQDFIEANVVPEPHTYSLLLGISSCLMLFSRRKRTNRRGHQPKANLSCDPEVNFNCE